jgi:two-component system cell cycle response regulator DivK
MPGKFTILYVEDDFNNRTLVRRVLEADGYQVVDAANANQAMGCLKEHKIDLILMDINMPEVDGYALTTQIKSVPEYAKTPIVAMTANVMRGDRERSLEAGCDGYIQKPIDIDLLTQQVERFLRSTNV